MTFSVVQNVNTSADGLNNDLVKINIWAYQWKISFKPDQNNQAQGVVFSRKINKKKTIPFWVLIRTIHQKLIHKNI